MTSFSLLASGSAGNAALLKTDTTAVLIDCGLSAKELTRRLALVGQKPEDLDAVLVGHEHGDHASGLGVFLRYCIKRGRAVPIYATPLCHENLEFGNNECAPIRYCWPGIPFQIGDIRVDPFTIPHDAVEPINAVFTLPNGLRIGWSTDLGFIPPAMVRKFADCQVIVLESNHDVEMLRFGPHPEEVKIRVAGRFGHLSNDQAAEFLMELSPRTETVVLSHLSEDNNTPQIAEWSARKALAMCGSKARVMVASQREVLRVIE